MIFTTYFQYDTLFDHIRPFQSDVGIKKTWICSIWLEFRGFSINAQ